MLFHSSVARVAFAASRVAASAGTTPTWRRTTTRSATVAAWLLAALLGAPRIAPAQVVRGVVVDENTGRPIPGVVVALLDGAGKRVAAVLAGDDGRYAVRTTSPGRYGLRVERIGFRAGQPTPVSLRAGETVDVRLVTSPVPVMLSSVRVTGRTACVARAQDGHDVSAVWEEARKALDATDLTQREELFTARVSRFERTVDPRNARVLSYDAKQATGATRSPFVSIPASRLSAEGFVRQNESETIYFGPDAAVLLSDEFLNDHCFRLRQGPDGRSGLIGLEFEPVRGRDKADIAGTLWIDRQTSELRDLEYAYRQLPNMPTGVKSEDFGGRVQFRRMPSGAWIVERWNIRMPVLVDRGPNTPSNEAVIPGLGRPATERVRLAAIREEGGEVLETIARGVRRELATSNSTIHGIVFDSTRMAPLAGARVFLDGTQFSTQSAADGTFRLENVPEGTYSLGVVHARFDSLGIRAPALEAPLKAGQPMAVQLTGPSAATLMERDCRPDERGPGTAALRGAVRDPASGEAAVDVDVIVTWNRLEGQASRTTTAAGRTLRTRTDSSGRYEICGLPERVQLTARAVAGTRRSAPTQVLLPEGEVSVLDLAFGSTTTVAAAPDSVVGKTARPSAARTATTSVYVNPAMQAVERRQRRGGGTHLTRAQLERTPASRLTDLLRNMPGVTLRPNESGIPIVEIRRTKRLARGEEPSSGSGTISGGPTNEDRCPAEILVNTMSLENNGTNIDGTVQPRDVEAIEVYSGAQVPVEFATRRTNCGLVLIWTRAFAERADGTTP